MEFAYLHGIKVSLVFNNYHENVGVPGVPSAENVTRLQFTLRVIHAIPSPTACKWLCTENIKLWIPEF